MLVFEGRWIVLLWTIHRPFDVCALDDDEPITFRLSLPTSEPISHASRQSGGRIRRIDDLRWVSCSSPRRMLQALLLYCVVSRLSRASDGDVPAGQVPADPARHISAVRRYLHLLNVVHVMGGVGDEG